jgi:ABC-type antimicrobial peptide transport system permease subunit
VRSNHWEYLAFVLLALGLALMIPGSIIYFSYQQYPQRKLQYNGIQIPLIIVGACFMVLGILAFRRYRAKKKAEAMEGEFLPPPPPPPPPIQTLFKSL